MSDSRTKQKVIQHHLSNDLLQAPTLSPMRRSPDRDLSVDHPTQRPAPSLLQSAITALEQGQTHYVDVPGIAPLREALALYLQGIGLADYQQSNVLVTAGIQEGRFLTIQMIGDIFDCIALPEVVHPGARQAVGVRRLEVKRLPVGGENGFLPTVSGIRAVLEDGCRLLYLESPVRLTGATFDKAELLEIAEMLKAHDAAAVWDQGVAPWVVDGEYISLGAQPDMASRVAVLGEAWPGLGLESWQIGYIGANEDWIERMRSQKQIMSICTSTPSQFAAVAAPSVYPVLHKAQVQGLADMRAKTLEGVKEWDVKPLKGETVNIIALKPADANRAKSILRQKSFWFADGADFGAPGVLRLSVVPDGATLEALELLA